MKLCQPIINKFSGNVAGFKYLAIRATSRNDIHEKFKSTLSSGNMSLPKKKKNTYISFQTYSQNCKLSFVVSLRLSLYLPTWENSALNGKIFMKFYT